MQQLNVHERGYVPLEFSGDRYESDYANVDADHTISDCDGIGFYRMRVCISRYYLPADIRFRVSGTEDSWCMPDTVDFLTGWECLHILQAQSGRRKEMLCKSDLWNCSDGD